MATTTSKSSTADIKFPAFEPTALSSSFKDFVSVTAKTQRVILDATETMMLRQLKLTGELLEKTQTAVVNFDPGKQPEAYLEETKAAAECMQAAAKDNAETAIRAQSDVAEVVGGAAEAKKAAN